MVILYTHYCRRKKCFHGANIKNKLSNLKGTEIYTCLKTLKTNSFFRKTSLNDLIKFSLSIELKNYAATQELAGIGNPKNKPFFILNGNLILEFKKKLPADLFF